MWKGEKKTIKDIFENIESSVSDPTFVFALFNTFYKFYIAIIVYYKIQIFLTKTEVITDMNSLIQKNIGEADIPITYLKVFQYYNKQINNKNNTQLDDEELIEELNTKLNLLGIFILNLSYSTVGYRYINYHYTKNDIEEGQKQITKAKALIQKVNQIFNEIKEWFSTKST